MNQTNDERLKEYFCPTGTVPRQNDGTYLNPGLKVPEKDPHGRDPHQVGAKVDAGKNEYDMVLYSFPNALAHVDRIGKFGARKYTKGGFLEVPNGQVRYFNAEMRHGIKHQSGELVDPDSNELHLSHKAWNALAELELYLREQENKQQASKAITKAIQGHTAVTA